MLAEREHDHAAAGLRIRRVRIEREPSRERVLAQEKRERRADGRVGEAGQRLRRGDDVPHAANVGERDQQRGLALGVAQEPHQQGLVIVAPRWTAARSESSDSPGGRLSRRARRAGSSVISPQR